jgi:hypothetical protein
MYLPTFWKLTYEYKMHTIKNVIGWGIPVTFMGIIILILACWISYYSLYNWIFTSIIPPERGVKRKQLPKK